MLDIHNRETRFRRPARLRMLATLATGVAIPALAQGAVTTSAAALRSAPVPSLRPLRVSDPQTGQSTTKAPATSKRSSSLSASQSASTSAGRSGESQSLAATPDFASLAAPTFQSIDANGVDLLSGAFNITSPALSMGDKEHGLSFALAWNGSAWLPPVPGIWQNPDTNVSSYTVTLDGETAVFEPKGTRITTERAGDTFTNQNGDVVIEFNQIKPTAGGKLVCRYPTNGPLRTPMPEQCRFMSREGNSVYFSASGFTVYWDQNRIERDDDALFFRAVSNIFMFPSVKKEKDDFTTTGYAINTSAFRPGMVAENSSNGYVVYSLNEPYDASVAYTIQNTASDSQNQPRQQLLISTPSLSGGSVDPHTDSYLNPKNTTQTFTDPMQRQWKYSFDGSGNMTKVVTPAGRTATLTYDGSHRVLSYSNGQETWQYSYSAGNDADAATVTVTDPTGAKRMVGRSKKGGPASSVTDELNRTVSYGYDSYDRVTSISYPEGGSTTVVYDGHGNVTQRTQNAKPSVGGAALVTKAAFSTDCGTDYRPAVACFRPSSVTDPKGNVTSYTYDDFGRPTSITLASPTAGAPHPQTRYTYQDLTELWYSGGAVNGGHFAQGDILATKPLLVSVSTCRTNPSCAGTADETLTQYGYATGYVAGSGGNNMLPLSVTTKAGDGSVASTTSQAYDIFGNVTAIDGPLAGTADTVTRRYDADREVTGVIGPDPDGTGARRPIAERRTYDADGLITLDETGNVASAADASWSGFAVQQKVATGYDGAGRVVIKAVAGTGAPEAVTQTSYGQVGRLQCVVIRMNKSSYPTIGAAGALSGGSLPPSPCTATTGVAVPDRITKTLYDAAGQVTRTQAAFGTAAAADVAYAYTPDGKLDYIIDAKNNLTDYAYDGFDRLVKTAYPSATQGALAANAADYEQLGYDADGNVTSRRQRDGEVTTYSYDALNRLTAVSFPSGVLNNANRVFSYDLVGNMLSATASGGGYSTGDFFTWDALGRRLTERSQLNGGGDKTKTAAYDAAGNRIRLTLPDAGLYLTYDYDAASELTAIHENGGGVLASFGYDDLGRRTSRGFSNGTSTTYAYDGVSRLTTLTLSGGAQPLSIGLSAYNPAGQIGSRSASNDSYAWKDGYNVDRSYVANGLNQYTSVGGAAIGYGTRGNLISSAGWTYGYDSLNQLTSYTPPGGSEQRLVYDALGRLVYNSGATLRLDYDGNMEVGEYDSSGNLTVRYVHGPGTDEPLVIYQGTGLSAKLYLDADERGSIVRTLDGAGNLSVANSYDEYGVPGKTNSGRFQYTGQAWIASLGLYWYKARMYSPTLGRFMQTDPIGYGDGLNWHAYAHNDPVNFADSSGLGIYTDDNGVDRDDGCGETYCDIVVTAKISPISTLTGYDPLDVRGRPNSYNLGQGPQNPKPPVCNQRRLDLANALAAAGDSFDSTGDKALIGAGGVAVAGAAFGATGIGLPAGVTAGAVAGALATAGTISKGVGSALSVGAHVVAIGATGNYSLAGPAIFSGVAGILPFKLGPVASYLQDKVSGAASQMVGFGNIPASCPK